MVQAMAPRKIPENLDFEENRRSGEQLWRSSSKLLVNRNQFDGEWFPIQLVGLSLVGY